MLGENVLPINTEEKLHGAAVLRLWEELGSAFPNKNFSLKKGISRNSYSLHAHLPKIIGRGKFLGAGMFIKISNKRLPPWRYNFSKENQDEILHLKQTYGEVFAIFVAGNDGFACLDFDRLKEILDDHHESQEWVSVSRKHRENYRVSGNDGDLERTLPQNTFPTVIIDYFKNRLR
jgi:hypothetical protein